MKIPKSVGKLTKMFETLGAPDPESWARSQIDEDVLEMNPTSRECARETVSVRDALIELAATFAQFIDDPKSPEQRLYHE